MKWLLIYLLFGLLLFYALPSIKKKGIQHGYMTMTVLFWPVVFLILFGVLLILTVDWIVGVMKLKG